MDDVTRTEMIAALKQFFVRALLLIGVVFGAIDFTLVAPILRSKVEQSIQEAIPETLQGTCE